MKVEAYAKINWSLRITGKRADGYHDLETVFQQISLHDTLTFMPSSTLSLTCSDPTIPVDDTNLVFRAARAVGATAQIHLEKRIPAGGGLGGGSSDAAATLRALAPSDAPLADLAHSLGSDVPFFLVGGTAYATGRGEVLTPLPSLPSTPLLLLLPDERVLTREAFARITRYSAPLGIEAYRSREVFTNDFEEPVFAMLPPLRELKQRLYAAGAAWAGMSGSGSTIVGAFDTVEGRDVAATAFADVQTAGAMTL